MFRNDQFKLLTKLLLKNCEYNIIGIDNYLGGPTDRIQNIEYTNKKFRFYNNESYPIDNIFKNNNIDVILLFADIVGNAESMKLNQVEVVLSDNVIFTSILLEKAREYKCQENYFFFKFNSIWYLQQVI